MKKFLMMLLVIGSLSFSLTTDTTKFKGQVIECDTLVGADTIVHIYQMFVSDITGDFTLTYWMSDSIKFRYYESNTPSIGWFNMTLVDSAGTAADSASLYGPGDNMDIEPVLWTKWELIGWGAVGIIKYILKDRLIK